MYKVELIEVGLENCSEHSSEKNVTWKEGG